MSECDPEALQRVTASNDPAPVRFPPRGAFENVESIFDAAIKHEREKQAKYRTHPRDDDPPPRRAA